MTMTIPSQADHVAFPMGGLEPTVMSEAWSASIGRLAKRLHHRLSRAPRIAVMGEVNSGKSTLINALIGAPVVPTSFEANTGLPIRVFHAELPSLVVERADRSRIEITADQPDPRIMAAACVLHVGLPLPRLTAFELIDTPGLQSGDEELCARAVDVCRQAHLAIWCTTAMQAWKASELGVWQALPKRFKANGILAVTFKDAVTSSHDQGRLLGRIARDAAPHFKQVVMVSARDGIKARELGDPLQSEKLWHLSGAAELSAAVDAAVSTFILARARGAEQLLSTALIPARPTVSL